MEGELLVGAVGAYGIKYGMRIHDLYQYIEKALEDERGNAISIIGGG
jgi:ribosomal protein L37AE/L43A